MRLTVILLLTLCSIPTYAADRPLVIELFTSQGCSSCPPAERYVNSLANNPNLLPLAFHVDYWDQYGWKDPYSSPEHTQRQRQYRHHFHISSLYTPQVIVNGMHPSIGTKMDTINQFITSARRYIQQRDDTIPITFSEPEGMMVNVFFGEGKYSGRAPWVIWMFAYNKEETTQVRYGENSGKTLTGRNIVRAIRHVGNWEGKTKQFRIDTRNFQQYDALAFIIQQPGPGYIRAAATVDVPHPHIPTAQTPTLTPISFHPQGE